MFYGISEMWDKRNVEYHESNYSFISNDSMITGQYEVVQDRNLNSKSSSERIEAINIATTFANLYKFIDKEKTLIDEIINFIKRFGMMGINREKRGTGFVEFANYSESLFEWKKEITEMYQLFKNYEQMRKNLHPWNESKVHVQNTINSHLTEIYPYTLADLYKEKYNPTNKEEEKEVKSISNEYLRLLDKKNNGNITSDFHLKINNLRHELDKYGIDFISLEEKRKLYKYDIVFRPMMRTITLLNSMYFSIFQTLQGSDSVGICIECGSFFLVTPRKVIKEKCSDCITKKRNKRKNENKRSDPINYFLEIVRNRMSYQLGRTDNIPFENIDIFHEWYEDLREQAKGIIDNENLWIEKKDDEYYKIFNNIKKED